ncbi:TIGR03016 family PEP-CTERM system-associated outer membrane protein [Pelomonas cellulosilytica]|uniref:TIGR03016 family PEP-CTERM system-associated outer membrane protein n=1 Tax=Pelomonas cellulosilytica TaxID=2906762 RepID=A0ABS8XY18_9BURK|nr:TIGR03016 family PEP-CTERM system-associated outer membrane protein [Pelomonas sp. P8]MCE4557546.1 TIGR03016 family PEP-CTERM system-associated outer membrane protein [Pelomonas sp. P8]
MAHAQDADRQGGGLSIQPRLSVTQTWTDNLRLEAQNKDAALITTVSPGVRIASSSGALRGSLDYSLDGIAYLKTDQPARLQNSLSANGLAELVPGRLFVEGRASIGQQDASAFGVQSAPTLGSQGALNNLANPNQRETSTLSLSPSLRGRLGGIASYELRGDFTRTDVRGSSLGDAHGSGGTLRISQLNPGVTGWWVIANTQQTSAQSTSSNRSDTVKAGVDYRPDPDWSVAFNVGQERSNYLGDGNQDGATGGVSAQWTPTTRTRISGDWQHHSYGDSHGFNFEHRMSRSVWRFSDSVTTMLGNVGPIGGVRSLYDQFFLLFASLEPDLAKRDVLVRSYLQSQGLSPDAPVAGGFLSSGPSRMRSQQASVMLQGVRSTLSLQAVRSITGRVGDNQNQGDLANNARVEQRSYSISASHQLTPLSGVSLTASRQETTGDAAGQPAVQLTSLITSWNLRLGARLSVQLGARHSRFDGVTSYAENAVYGNLIQTF